MAYAWWHRLAWWLSMLLMVCLPRMVDAQQPAQSDTDVARQGALALAAAHGEKPRYGGKFLSVGNEEIPLYDMHQTSFGGVYAATALFLGRCCIYGRAHHAPTQGYGEPTRTGV